MVYLSIILQTCMIWCVTGRPLPCPIVDKRTGAMLCCNYHKLSHGEGESNQILESEKTCTLLTPKTSLGLLKEVWSMRNYTWAKGMLKTTLPETKTIPRLKDCCYEENIYLSINNHGVSAQTGETCNIFQQDEHVQPVLNVVCVKKDTCHNSAASQIFQKLEVRSLYVEAQDHPEYVHQELVLMPSGCLCVTQTQTVQPESGTFLIPMNLLDDATSDSHVVKRNIENNGFRTELPEVLQLALEIMREPNPLPVLNSVERQMSMQLQQTKYLTAIAMATGFGGRFSHIQGFPYGQDHQENITQADKESSLVSFLQDPYHLILSSFLAGLTAGQNVHNISQIEILDRLIIDNGDSGMNLLETILELQNASFAYDYNPKTVDRNDTYTANIGDSTVNTDSIADTTINTFSNKDYTTDSVLIGHHTTQPPTLDDGTPDPTVDDGTPDPTVVTASNENYTTESPTIVDSTADIVVETLSPNEEYVTNSPESYIKETTFNLTKYIMELPQYKPITIDPGHLMHILFASDYVKNDESSYDYHAIDERGFNV